MVKFNAVSLGVTAAAIAAPAIRADDAQCKDLSMDSPLVKTLLSSTSITEDQAKPVVEAMKDSDLGKCVGSLEIADALPLAGVLSDDTCTDVAKKENLNKLISFSENPEDFLKSNSMSESACSILSSAVPCLEKKIIDQAYEVLSKKSCCKPLIDSAEKAVGPADKAAKTLVTDAYNTLCSTRESYTDKSKDITCLYAMMPAFFSDDKDALNFVRIPNDQGEKAFNGQGFTNTEKENVKFSKAYGACAVPLDNLMSTVSGMPFAKSGDAEKLFADGQCVESSKIREVLGEIPLVGEDLAGLIPNSSEACIHFANGFSKGANFDVDAKLPNGKSVSTLEDSMNSGTSDEKGGSNAGVMTSLSVATAVVAVAQFFM